jgi:Xaa-Pro dipeptidase
MMSDVKNKLIEAEAKALQLFQAIEDRKLIAADKSEKQLNAEIFALAKELFGIEKYWHKRIVRAGENTLRPYDDNPPDLIIQKEDILFLDFGPVFEDWEADFGRTYVLGTDPFKLKLQSDIEVAWQETKKWFNTQTKLTGAEFYQHLLEFAKTFGWEFGGEIGGHLIGQFPHEKLEPQNYGLYIHPENHTDMFLPDTKGLPRHWILEIHFVDREKQIGGFFEQLLT